MNILLYFVDTVDSSISVESILAACRIIINADYVLAGGGREGGRVQGEVDGGARVLQGVGGQVSRPMGTRHLVT